jgi:Flp pilus assembly protein TadD
MNRREFLAAMAAGGLLPTRIPAASPFPLHYVRKSPYDELIQYVEPGLDEFEGEKAALELEARLTRKFPGTRVYALPESRIRFETATPNRYETGIWQLPDLSVISKDSIESPRPYFRDVTSHVFGATPSFEKQLLNGNPYWRTHLDAATGIDTDGNQGIAVGDIDNDGVDEIYVCQSGGLPNRLYKLRADGTAEDITEHAGVGVLDETTCALFVDFRNSGFQDLVVLRRFGPTLYLNQSNGTFREQPDAFHFRKPAQGVFTGMAAADYDRDGRVDLYLCTYVYVQGEDQYQYPTPYHDARNGPPNFLFHNRLTQSGGVFEDVTEESGIGENNDRFSFAPAWCDYDGKGWPHLYVANDFGRNNLYRNREGHFKDESAACGVEDIGAGMSACWFDYDGDGRPDLYVSNMWSAAGQRIVRDPAFRPGVANQDEYRRHAKGNSLYRNKGDGTFGETGAKENVEMGRWAWSSGGFDFDLDGAPEIFIASGMTTNGASGKPDLDSFFWRQVVANSPSTLSVVPEYENGWNTIGQLFRGGHNWRGHEPNVFYKRRDGRYIDASGISGLDFADDSRAFAVTDFDGDGYPDILLKSRRGPQLRALQNDCATGKPAVALSLRGTKSNRDAIGARVEVNGNVQYVNAGSGFLSQHSKRLHFAAAGSAKITWPSGLTQTLEGLQPGYTYTITEGSHTPSRVPFRPHRLLNNTPVKPNNSAAFGDTWLLQPVPTPQRHEGPGFITLEAADLSRQQDDIAATWSLFHRYLFEYRAELELPLTILIDNESRARKIYANVPSDELKRADLLQIGKSRELALPFPGRYILPPRRNYFKLGVAFYWAGYPDRALPYLEEELRARPDSWNVLLALGRIHQELGHADEALTAFHRVQTMHPGYAPAILGEGLVLLQRKEPSAARAAFLKTLDVDPKCAEAANELGLLAAQSNQLDEARNWFHRAIEAVPGHAEAVNNLGVFYAQIRQYPDAVAALRYGLQYNPGNEPLYLNLTRIFMIMGQRDDARAVLAQLLERHPENALGHKLLTELEAR